MHPVFEAIANGQRQRVREFAAVEGLQDPAGRTPLLWACSYLEPLIAADLLEARTAAGDQQGGPVGEEHLMATVAAEARLQRFWRAQRTGAPLSEEAQRLATRLLDNRALWTLKVLRAHGAAASPATLKRLGQAASEHGWTVVPAWLLQGATAELPIDIDAHLYRQASGWTRNADPAVAPLSTDELLHELLLAGDLEAVVWCHGGGPTSDRRALRLEIGQLRGQFCAKFGTVRPFPALRFTDAH